MSTTTYKDSPPTLLSEDKMLSDAKQNYIEWRDTIHWILRGRNVWEVVTNDHKEPEDKTSEEYRVWKRMDNIAIGQIMSNIAPHNLSHIRRKKDQTSHEVWTRLEKFFRQMFAKRQQTIQAELSTMIYTPGTDLREHIQRMDEKREELILAGYDSNDNHYKNTILTSLRCDRFFVIRIGIRQARGC